MVRKMFEETRGTKKRNCEVVLVCFVLKKCLSAKIVIVFFQILFRPGIYGPMGLFDHHQMRVVSLLVKQKGSVAGKFLFRFTP